MAIAVQQRRDLFVEYYQTRSLHLRNRIATANAGLVKKIARKESQQCPEPYQDLEQIGFLGLIRAIEKFNPANGAAFSSFAVPYIRGEIQHFLRDHWGNSAKVPRRAIELHSKVKRLHRKLAIHGRKLTEAEVAEKIGVEPQKWQWVCEAMQRKPLLDVDDLSESLADSQVDIQEDGAGIYQHLGKLPNPYRAILVAHFVGGYDRTTIARQQVMSLAEVDAAIEDGLYWLRCHLNE